MNMLHAKTISCASFGDKETENLSYKCIKYFRFEKKVLISQLKLYPVITRNAGSVHLYAQPAHIIVESYCKKTENWILVKDAELPRFESADPRCIDVEKIETDLVRVICDKEHPVQRTHAEFFASPDVVPINTLKRVEFFGEELTETYEPEYNEPMTRLEINPGKIPNVEISVKKYEIVYCSKYFKAVFSLRRPIMTWLSYDCLGQGKTDMNVLQDGCVWINGSIRRGNDMICCITGPRFVNAGHNVDGTLFTGEVCVKDDYIIFKNVRFNEFFSTDIKFTINEKGMRISIEKEVFQDFGAIEADDFRFVLDDKKTISGIQGLPQEHMSRVGLVKMPAALCSPGLGNLDIVSLDGKQQVIQVDDYRDYDYMAWFSPVVGGEHDEYGFIHFKKGKYSSTFAMTIGGVQPVLSAGYTYDKVPDGLKKGLTAALSFRADFVGFANNFLSGNCHLAQFHVAEMVPYFRKTSGGLDMAELLRFTMECSLRNGPGYGDCRELFMDSDPSVLIAVARVYQLLGDRQWIIKYWNRIRETAYRIIESIDENGIMKSGALTGNSGSKAWSSNTMDVIGFGNYDAYSNALGYRALKNTIVLAQIAGDEETARICRNMADAIYGNYERIFINPESGYVSGWVSADGEHHDYMFTWVNSMAICFGLISPERSRSILQGFMNKFEEMSLDYFDFGLPLNLISIRNEDVPLSDGFLRADGKDRFEHYLNGSLTPLYAFYFVRALTMYGMEKEADLIGNDLLDSFGRNTFYGGALSGTEYFTWQGHPCAYEGPLIGMFPALSAIAIRKGIVEPLKEEWWLEERSNVL